MSTYKFTFDSKKSKVLKQYEYDDGEFEQESIKGYSFEITKGKKDGKVDLVEQSKVSKGFLEVSVFTDYDHNNKFQEVLGIEVAGRKTSKLELHKFTFNSKGAVTKDQELKSGTWKTDKIEKDESFDVLKLNGTKYVIKTETSKKSIEFEIFKDGNGDKKWTQIAEGEVLKSSAYFDKETGTVDLVGIQSYLGHADNILG